MKRLSVFATLILAVLHVWAYDFSVTAPSGQTLYFNYVDGGVEVTCPGSANANAWNGFSKPSGALVLPTTVTSSGATYSLVGVGRYAFYGCYSLTSVVVPEGVATLGQASFSGCTAIDSVSLPSTLVSLGNTVFNGCTSLSAISLAANVPPTLAATTFNGVVASNCLLYVPCAAAAAYTAATGWSDFDIVNLGSCNATVTLLLNNPSRGSVTGAGTYALGTTITVSATPAVGFFFAFWGDGDTNNPRLLTLTADTSLTAMFYPALHDTLTTTIVVHDTVIVHDTTYVPVVYVDTVTIYDTIFHTDTLQLHDTVVPTYFRLQVPSSEGGVGIGNALVPAGTEMELGALPLEGYRFAQWDDGSVDNPRRLTLTANVTLTPSFLPLTGVSAAVSAGWTAVAEGRSLVLSDIDARVVTLYDVQGRRLFQGCPSHDRMVLRLPAAGIYLVSVDGSPARKVVVD